jgi:glucose-6-phosphate isomerase
MADNGIKLYYKNVTAQVIDEEHGITDEQFKDLAEKTTPLIGRLKEERDAGKTPYRELPYNTDLAAQVKQLAGEFKDKCKNLVVLGIGGSALGNIALQTALNPYMYNIDKKQRSGTRLFVFDNVDPDQLNSFLNWNRKKLKKTVFNVISKSGRTAETAAQFLIVRKMLLDKLGPDGLKEHVVATTDPQEGTLRKIADEANLRCLEVPEGVGGRFSVLSAVGLFSAAMCGIDIDLLLEGARDMDKRVSETDFYKNPAAINAAIHYHYYDNNKRMSVIMPYSYALKDLADWYRQLWAESLGKTKDLQGNDVHVGPTPVKALGTTDQHSQVQLYREGPNDKLFTFLQVNNFDNPVEIGPNPESAPELYYLAGKDLGELFKSEKQATEFALLQDKRPCLTVIFDRVNPYTVGQFIYLYEVTTSLVGAFGKEATFALMERPGFEDLRQKIAPYTKLDKDYLL